MKTYWNGDGKYQDWYDKIADTMPSMYDTDNSNMNLFIYVPWGRHNSHLYEPFVLRYL